MAKKSLLQDFKEFAVRGNLLDLAIGIIIGTAFTRIVNSLVQSVIMPALGMIVGNFDFKHLQWVLKPAEVDAAGNVVEEAVIVKYGEFIQAMTDFLIIAIVVFIVVKMLNSWKNKAEDPKNPEVKTPKDIQLLTEIRDLLKERNSKAG
ncbi:large-conductance mechanosensitive channel protein MscL [Cesiribacter sp. SM1]|uniref:large-conductance mechanosensitive channel protein MscL n=1 Tax=Cesiribacter sp. SM1 TaxID=2861196 RepID=UPI001CD4EB09|nr:large-conductance mechanosensitive channel protein MscL [Cesiribacter sp. SM1]